MVEYTADVQAAAYIGEGIYHLPLFRSLLIEQLRGLHRAATMGVHHLPLLASLAD